MHNGTLRIPDFQRAFIWGEEQIMEFLKSISLGYPIGSILVWATTERLKELNPARLALQDLKDGIEARYLLDGQQRLVTLLTILKNNLQIGGRKHNQYRAFYNLATREFKLINKNDLVGNTDATNDKTMLPVDEAIKIDWPSKSSSMNMGVLKKLESTIAHDDNIQSYIQLYERFTQLALPTVIVRQDLGTAATIFERTNNTGTVLTVVDLMVAKTYTEKFNLRNRINDLTGFLDARGFSISDRTILQCFSACLKGGISREHILGSGERLEAEWNIMEKSLKIAIDRARDTLGVPTSKFLPYDVMLAPLTAFFYNRPATSVDPTTARKLKRYVLHVGLSERYVQGQNPKAEADITEMNALKSDNSHDPFTEIQVLDAKKVRESEFSAQSAVSRTILWILGSKEPLNLVNNTRINLGTSFAEVNNRSLHHIFPKDFLQTKYGGDKDFEKEVKPYINSMANIALVPLGDNIGFSNRPPSEYITELQKKNSHLSEALSSHLIGDLKEFGILDDDFESFLHRRSSLIADTAKALVSELMS
ncbi:MAG: DUF262 domain-containing protein [Nitrososphaerales archaeon]|nr:DUF262 domain-containing protein [Nitrososphaerales archaeon]